MKSKTCPVHIRSNSMAFLGVALVVFFYATSLYAHNLWVIGDANKNGDGTVHLYFEHHVGPGDGEYLGPIAKRGKTWFRTMDGNPTQVELKPVEDGNLKYLKGETGNAKSSFSLDHSSLYGIYHGRLDFFYGRYIQADNTEDLAALSESPNLPFQIVPVWMENGLLLRVKFFSKPYPRAKLILITPDGAEKEFETDNKGEVVIPGNKTGAYHFSAYAFDNDAAGAFEYEAYKGIMYGTTLSIKISNK